MVPVMILSKYQTGIPDRRRWGVFEKFKIHSHEHRTNKYFINSICCVLFSTSIIPFSPVYSQPDPELNKLFNDWSELSKLSSFVPCKDGSFDCSFEQRQFPVHEGFELYFVSPESKYLIYLQKEPVIPVNGLGKIWTLSDYTYSQYSHKTIRTFYSIDCRNSKYSIIQQDQTPKFGNPITLGPEGKSYFISPGSFPDKLRKHVCK